MYSKKLPSFQSKFGSCVLLLLVLLAAVGASAQNVAINADGSRPNKNAMLDIQSNSKGLLIPRMTTDARLKIEPTQGLMVYDINTNSFWYNNGKLWKNMAFAEALAATGSWMLTGNAGTTDVANFLGTTDNVPLNIRVNNQQSGRIDNTLGNTFWGFRSGFNISTGNDNTGIGASALFTNTTGYNNTGVGSSALQSNTTGFHNSAFGRLALLSNTTGFNNTASGTSSLFTNTTGNSNTAYGAAALYSNTRGDGNAAYGRSAMFLNTFGVENTAIGTDAMHNNNASANTATGYAAMFNNTTGGDNTANGYYALYSNQTTAANTAIGFLSLFSFTGGPFTIRGLNTACGAYTLSNTTTGSGNSAFGSEALNLNTGGDWNTAVGGSSAYNNSTGFYNTAVGSSALFNNTTGILNTAVGVWALGWNTSGFGNTALGAGAGTGFSGFSYDNSTAIGYDAVVNASNKVRIGNAAVTVIEGQVPFTFPSDGRYKFQVQEDVHGLDFILQLRPVTYRFDTRRFDAELAGTMEEPKTNDTESARKWKSEVSNRKINPAMEASYNAASSIRRSGFIAQEVEQAAKNSGYNFSGIIAPGKEQQHYSLSYDAFVVPLVKAVQEQQQVIQQQRSQLSDQQKVNAEQQKINAAQNKKLADMQLQLDELQKLLKARSN